MGFIICIVYISHIWRKNFGGFMGEHLLFSANYLTGILPTDKKFLSLKFSAFRHAFVFLVCASLIYFVNIDWLNSALLWVNLIYAGSAVWRQTTRKKALKSSWEEYEVDKESPVIPLQKQTLKATAAVATYSVYLAVLLYAVYAVRP